MSENFRGENIPFFDNMEPKETNREKSEQAENMMEELQRKHPDYNLIADKILRCRAITGEELGSTNVYLAADYLYDALYSPKNISERIPFSEEYPDRLPALTKELNLKPQEIPTREEFITSVRHAMTNEVDFSQCLSEEAKKQMKNIMEKSEQTVIWTDGDTYGVPERGLPGSKEQLKKLAGARFYNKARREIAKDRGENVNHTDVLSVASIEGKMKCIPDIVDEFSKKGIERIIIIDDRMENLLKAKEIINNINPKLEIFPIWTRVSIHKDKIREGKNLEEWSKELNAIDNIGDLNGKIDEGKIFDEDAKVCSIVDLDGPLHDDAKRKEIQTRAVIDSLQRRGWLGEIDTAASTEQEENSNEATSDAVESDV